MGQTYLHVMHVRVFMHEVDNWFVYSIGIIVEDTSYMLNSVSYKKKTKTRYGMTLKFWDGRSSSS